MQHNHIMSAFDRDLEAVQAHLMRLGGLAEQALRDAMTALETNDTELAAQVRAGDKALDQLEELIYDESAKLIALRAPAAKDMRLVLGAIKVAGSLERIGDYAKNIAKRSIVLSSGDQIGSAVGTLRRMSRHVEAMLHDVLDAYVRLDVAAAHEIRARDEDVDQIYNSLFRMLLTHMMEDPRTITSAMHLHFIAKNVERMGDHVTTIAEELIYLVEGERPDERVRADKTSVTPLKQDE